MTNHWADMQNAKCFLVEGSNVAENHPMAFKWIRKAQENGAILIHVDPRFTRTSAGADVYARIRPGTDAAFQNTVINYLITHRLYDEDYVTIHTNALLLGNADFDSARDKVLMGVERKSVAMSEKERVTCAYHEAGHAVVAALLPEADPLHKVTIIPRGRALGVTMSLPERDRYSFDREYMLNQIAMLFGCQRQRTWYSGTAAWLTR